MVMMFTSFRGLDLNGIVFNKLIFGHPSCTPQVAYSVYGKERCESMFTSDTLRREHATAISKVEIFERVGLRPGAADAVTTLNVKTLDHYFQHAMMPHELWNLFLVVANREYLANSRIGVKSFRFLEGQTVSSKARLLEDLASGGKKLNEMKGLGDMLKDEDKVRPPILS